MHSKIAFSCLLPGSFTATSCYESWWPSRVRFPAVGKTQTCGFLSALHKYGRELCLLCCSFRMQCSELVDCDIGKLRTEKFLLSPLTLFHSSLVTICTSRIVIYLSWTLMIASWKCICFRYPLPCLGNCFLEERIYWIKMSEQCFIFSFPMNCPLEPAYEEQACFSMHSKI